MLSQLAATLFALLALVVGGARAGGANLTSTSKRNVILIIADDLRAQIDTEGFPFPNMHTPNLKRLSSSKGAFTFTRAYVQQALCAPSRNSFLTGRRPNSTLA